MILTRFNRVQLPRTPNCNILHRKRLFSLVFVIICLILLSKWIKIGANNVEDRSFRVDYDNDRFLKDGKPFRFIAGSFHYFRAIPTRWRHILRTMRAAGLNAVTTYIEWFTHNPYDGQYKWDGMANVEEFIRLAAEEDLLVILRPGPFICAEREAGGYPHWLYRKYPNIELRTNDPNYKKEVSAWFDKLMPRIQPHLYGNGGPIIMVQVENEYGMYNCDKEYKEWMRDEIAKHVGDKAVIFTNDYNSEDCMRCGSIENVLATIDFGPPEHLSYIDEYWHIVRKILPRGPLVNAEFYIGWSSEWNNPHQYQLDMEYSDTNKILGSLRKMLESGASVNIYMFYGGTNFGFTAGTHSGGENGYQAYITTYFLSALINEAGDIMPNYLPIRDVIKDFLPLPNVTVSMTQAPKMQPPPIELHPKTTLLSSMARHHLGNAVKTSQHPMKFEELDQFAGFLLYEAFLPDSIPDPSILHIPHLHDRAIVCVDDVFVGILYRETKAESLPMSLGYGRVLQIIVEHHGRNNFEIHQNEFKGIIGDVWLNHEKIENWNHTQFPFEDQSKLNEFLQQTERDANVLKRIENQSIERLLYGPVIFEATFDINSDELFDTYIDTSGWGKGFIILNDHNLGRYWPIAGPQISLYVPKEFLRNRGNSIVVIEMQRAPANHELKFSKQSIIRYRSDKKSKQK